MNAIRLALPPLLFLIVSGCSVFESGSPAENPREQEYLSTEYGDVAPNGVVPVQIDGRNSAVQVWLGTKHSRIMVEASPTTRDATTGFASKLTMGFVDRPLDQTPYREAAIRYLAENGKTGCELKSGGQIAHNRFEWRFDCARSPAALVSQSHSGATKPRPNAQ